MNGMIKKILALLLSLSAVLSFAVPVLADRVFPEDLVEIQSTVSSKTSCNLIAGVVESAVKLNSGHDGFMLQVSPTAKANLKVSYSRYFTAGSSKASRSEGAKKLTYSFTTPTAQATAYETATSHDVIFAMNANFASIDTAEPFGLIKVEGNTIHPSDKNGGIYFAILRDGSYDFRTYTEDHSDVVEAVAGRQWLVRNGVQIKQSTEQISARTAIGLKADGTLVTFVVNGKTNSSGVTINDMSELMFSLGCVNAINLDGGGSSLFATQRTNNTDLVIRNDPADAGGERAVSSALLLVAQPETDRLYFDFTNDKAAQLRYEKDVYDGRNYDTGNWHYTHTYSTAPVFDSAAGTMSFTTTADYPTTRDIHPLITSSNTSYTGGHPLKYVPTGSDYFKVRMKIEGSPDTDANFRLMYASDDSSESNFTAFSTIIPSGCINNGYFTLEGYLDFKEVDTVKAIRPEVYNLTIPEPGKITVKFTYDYIYVGPKDASSTQDYLLFEFADDATSRERYDTITYGFMNFDRSSNPYWATNYNGTTTAFHIANGTLNVDVTDGHSGSAEDGNLTYGPWIKTTNTYGQFTGRTTYSLFPFSFDPKNSQVLQIRFRVENCTVPDGKTPNLVLEYYYTKDDTHAYKNDIRKPFALNGGEFQILTVPVTEAFLQGDRIKCIGFRFQNLMSGTKGNIAIDYIYIGPACTAPEGGHTWNEGIVTTNPTCTSQGEKTYTCIACDLTKTEPVEAVGHCYTYSKVNDLVHMTSCANCDLRQESPHSYTEGLCSCGQIEGKEPVEETGWKLGHTLNLASDISVNWAIGKSYLEGFDIDSVYALVEMDIYNGDTKIGVKTVEIGPVEQGNYYYFTLSGFTAVNMNDEIRAVLYGIKNDRLYYSPVDEYSISTYAYSQLNKAGTPDTLKTLCADLLRYGAKAQIFKGYRTDTLADSSMTETHKVYLSDIESVKFGNTNRVLNDLENAPIAWAGKSLNLESKVALKFIYDYQNYTGDPADLTLRVCYKDGTDENKTLIIDNGELYNEKLKLYAFTLDVLLAAELRSVISVQIYAGETPVSCTLQYSADTYGNNKTGALLELCKALFAYSDSAKVYFTQS